MWQHKGMWQRFNESARRSILIAQKEAMALQSISVEPPHIFLGLIIAHSDIADQMLQETGVSLDAIRLEIETEFRGSEASSPSKARWFTPLFRRLGWRNKVTPASEPALSPHTMRVLKMAAGQAAQMRKYYIGGEHLLLVLLNDKKSLLSQTLYRLGINVEEKHLQLMRQHDIRNSL